MRLIFNKRNTPSVEEFKKSLFNEVSLENQKEILFLDLLHKEFKRGVEYISFDYPINRSLIDSFDYEEFESKEFILYLLNTGSLRGALSTLNAILKSEENNENIPFIISALFRKLNSYESGYSVTSNILDGMLFMINSKIHSKLKEKGMLAPLLEEILLVLIQHGYIAKSKGMCIKKDSSIELPYIPSEVEKISSLFNEK